MGLGRRAASGFGASSRADRAASSELSASHTLAVIGDLHIEPNNMSLFLEARDQLRRVLRDANSSSIVQLGDLGGYSSEPGSTVCFERARAYLDGFGAPYRLVLGNHDLEGIHFATDAENIAAWQAVFKQEPFWEQELGATVLLGLSTTRFRLAPGSCHEVFIDDDQLAWFRAAVARHTGRPIIVFSHAPPLGSGLTVLQDVHVKNRCCWLNHSAPNAGEFMRIVNDNPHIKLWLNGHFHLSHDYAGSVVVRGATAFVQVGVLGPCHRDGRRHSRILKVDDGGYELHTMDHNSGNLRLDLAHRYASGRDPEPVALPPGDVLTCESLGITARLVQSVEVCRPGSSWSVGSTELHVHRGTRTGDLLLVEYDAEWAAPTGVVSGAISGRRVRVVDSAGAELGPAAGAAAVAVELVAADGAVERIERNAEGCFYRMFQVNRWRKKVEEGLAKAAAADMARLAGQGFIRGPAPNAS